MLDHILQDSAAPDDGNPSEVDAIIKEALYKTFVMRIRVHVRCVLQ